MKQSNSSSQDEEETRRFAFTKRRSLSLLRDSAIVIGTIALVIYLSGSYFSHPIEQSSSGLITSYSFTLQQIKGNISPEDAYALIQKNVNNSDFVIIDVRTESEFLEGHIENAVNVDFNSEDFSTRLDDFDKDKTYLIYCASGNRSGKVYTVMMELGFSTVYDLSGGIVAWVAEGFPVVR